MALRYVLADPQPFFRRALVVALSTEDGFEHVGDTGDEEEAASLASEGAADVILTEIELDRGSGLHLSSRTTGEVPVIVLTRYPEGDIILDVAASGAAGCIGHAAGLERLTSLIRDRVDGTFCVDGLRLREILVRAGRSNDDDVAAFLEPLSVREREVLRRVATGANDDSIAEALYISRHTVRTHVGNILRKLGVHSRAEAARIALASGLEPRGGLESLRIEGPRWMS